MIKVDLRDPNLAENIDAIYQLRKSGTYSEEQIQEMYSRQLETDRRRGNDEK